MKRIKKNARRREPVVDTMAVVLTVALAITTIHAQITIGKLERAEEMVETSPEAGVIAAVRELEKDSAITIVDKDMAVSSEPQEQEDAAGLDYTDEESTMLLKLAQAEAGNQGVIGKALVMNVIHNRVQSDKFPNTIEEVIFQVDNGVYQFTPIQDGHYDSAVPDQECYEALEMVLNYWDGSNGALYFEVTSTQPTWHSKNLTELFAYGDTTFYK